LSNNNLEHPELLVAIGGTDIEQRPSSFSLTTDEGMAASMARIQFPADTETGKQGEEITIRFALDEKEHLLYTGEIFTAQVYEAYRDLRLVNSMYKLILTNQTLAYRKETAKTILQDIVDAAGIKKSSITCPSVEIARFSTNNIPSHSCIYCLIDTLAEHGHPGLRFYFDSEDIFHFGTIEDTEKNDAVYEFTTGQNIFRKMDNKIEVLPLPIRQSQTVSVDGEQRIVSRSHLAISGSHSRLTLWLREAV
jgi:hypothetical protein